MKKMLVIDTETGGLDPTRNAILSIACVVYNDGPEESIHLVINDPDGVVNEQALEINGFTRERIEREGISPREACNRIRALLNKNGMHGRTTLAGHNLPFDVGFLVRLFRIGEGDLRGYDKLFNYGGLDTKGMALALEQAERIKPLSSSLIHVAPSVGVGPWKEHDALEDALATARVLRKMIDMMRRFATG